MQGHLRVVLIPIVYNALSQKSMLRSLGLFKALHRCGMGLERLRRGSRCPIPPPTPIPSGHTACARVVWAYGAGVRRVLLQACPQTTPPSHRRCRAMKQSTYFPLLRPPPDDFMEELDAELAKES